MSTTNFWDKSLRGWGRKLWLFGASMPWALLLTLIVLLPEWIFSKIFNGFTPYWGVGTLLVVYLLNLLIVNSYYRRASLALGGFLYFLQMSALLYYRYFGTFYGPSDVMLLFFDADEVFKSLAGVARFIMLPLLVELTAFVLFVYVYRRLHGRLLQSRGSFILFSLLLVAPAINAGLEDNSQRYEPDGTNLAIKNALYSVSYFLGSDLPKRISGNYVIKQYAPYNIEAQQRPGTYHVVLIMGESLTSTHMSLYGYERPTTPFLERLRDEGKLIHRHGISAAVSTRVSIPMFMNAQYEPDNWSHIANKESSLLHLAKQAGFQTAFLSGQMIDGTSSLMTSNAIDHWLDARNIDNCSYDECLISFMQRAGIDWSHPAFVVLNQRSAHSPYQDNYPPDFARFSKVKSGNFATYKVAAYDDAVRYVDHNIERIVDHLHATSTLPVIIVMTADHGEMMGENGRFGHNVATLSSARVPFLFYSENAPAEIVARANALPPVMPHYEMARFIANLLGYNINNPNTREGDYFINGVDLMGRAGYTTYRLRDLPECRTDPGCLNQTSKPGDG